MDRGLPEDPPEETWPELTYRYVKHYYWEPQHLRQTARTLDEVKASGKSGVDVVDRKLRSQEVPLNHLLNVLLRIAPSSLRAACLKPFGIDLTAPDVWSLSLRESQDLAHIQPDIHLESDNVRVFIELKVKARLDVEQIEKYVAHHATLNARHPKTSYLLLLVKNDPVTVYSEGKRSGKIHLSAAQAEIQTLLRDVAGAGAVFYGATTWSAFGDALRAAVEERRGEQPESDEMVDVLVGDFLDDLAARGLWAR